MWEGTAGLVYVLVNISIPVILLYLLFQMRVLGAGDIKLFSVASCFFTWRQICELLVISLVAAAAAGIIKILYLLYKKNYVWKTKTRVHFSIFILTGYMITVWRCVVA